jgi:hypothetical protein
MTHTVCRIGLISLLLFLCVLALITHLWFNSAIQKFGSSSKIMDIYIDDGAGHLPPNDRQQRRAPTHLCMKVALKRESAACRCWMAR